MQVEAARQRNDDAAVGVPLRLLEHLSGAHTQPFVGLNEPDECMGVGDNPHRSGEVGRDSTSSMARRLAASKFSQDTSET